MKVLLTGATGLIGKKLAIELLKGGHSVTALARNPSSIPYLPQNAVFPWRHTEVPAANAVRGNDAIVHLAGENVAEKRWSADRKRALSESRVAGTANLVTALERLPPAGRPKVFVCASAIGYYGSRGDEALSESSGPGRGFLTELCVAWEREANRAAALGVRVVKSRFGVVLTAQGGALAKMGPVILGSGEQWLSWVHVDDVTGFIHHALKESSVSGDFNLTAPHPVRQKDFARALQRARRFPFGLKVPSVLISTALGEMSEMVLGSQRVLPERTQAAGYEFRFPALPEALKDLSVEYSPLDVHFKAAQFVPVPREKIVPYFGEADNLEELTPPWLGFRILRKSSPQTGQGSVIDYRISIHGVPVTWRTLISDWNLPDSFTDDQLKGPYRKWHHVHDFFEVNGGTLLTDHVTYRVPLSWLGKLLLGRWVAADVRGIFGFRAKKIAELARTEGFSSSAPKPRDSGRSSRA